MLGGGLSREEAVLDCNCGPDFSQQNNNKALHYQKATIIEVLPIESKTIPFQIGLVASLESWGLFLAFWVSSRILEKIFT